jgi:hypothetical protein
MDDVTCERDAGGDATSARSPELAWLDGTLRPESDGADEGQCDHRRPNPGEHRHWTRIDDRDLRLRYHDAVQSLGWRPVEPCFHLFVVDIADVTAVRYAKPRRV